MKPGFSKSNTKKSLGQSPGVKTTYNDDNEELDGEETKKSQAAMTPFQQLMMIKK
jgi:hypothetical protein